MKSVDAVVPPAGDTYCSEEYFQRTLILERKRSDRSGKPFLLILLDIAKLLKGKREEKEAVLQKLSSALASSTREIDVKGWYMHDSIIGIICQDVYKKDWDSVSGKLGKKLIKGRQFSLDAKKVDAIKMIRLFYPEIQEQQQSGLNAARSLSGKSRQPGSFTNPPAGLAGRKRLPRAAMAKYR